MLSTAPPGSPVAPDGQVTLSGAGLCTGGFLSGSTGTVAISGTITPVPWVGPRYPGRGARPVPRPSASRRRTGRGAFAPSPGPSGVLTTYRIHQLAGVAQLVDS